MSKRKQTLTIFALLLALLLAACGGGAEPTSEPAAPAPTTEAMEEETMDEEMMDEEMDETMDGEMDEAMDEEMADETMNENMDDESMSEEMDDETMDEEMDDDSMGDEAMDENMDDEDMAEEMMDMSAIYATSNPGELENDAIVSIAPDFGETMNSISAFAEGVTSVESIALTSDGTYYLTVDLGEESGAIVALDDLNNMSPEALAMSADLTAPKGLYIAEEAGLVLVADFGAQAIAAYDLSLTPQFTITDFGDAAGSVWDVYHDAASDTLFATGTDGTLIVYENFSEMMGAEGPSKTIVPADADGNKISVNLHGVAYYAANDELILTDVGDAASAEDGALFVISNASEAEGNTTVSVMIAGPDSWLGNPVDVVFDGNSAYVAEKSNDAILRFDDVLATDMMGDAAPSATFELLKAESVWLSSADMMMSDG